MCSHVGVDVRSPTRSRRLAPARRVFNEFLMCPPARVPPAVRRQGGPPHRIAVPWGGGWLLGLLPLSHAAGGRWMYSGSGRVIGRFEPENEYSYPPPLCNLPPSARRSPKWGRGDGYQVTPPPPPNSSITKKKFFGV